MTSYPRWWRWASDCLKHHVRLSLLILYLTYTYATLNLGNLLLNFWNQLLPNHLPKYVSLHGILMVWMITTWRSEQNVLWSYWKVKYLILYSYKKWFPKHLIIWKKTCLLSTNSWLAMMKGKIFFHFSLCKTYFCEFAKCSNTSFSA